MNILRNYISESEEKYEEEALDILAEIMDGCRAVQRLEERGRTEDVQYAIISENLCNTLETAVGYMVCGLRQEHIRRSRLKRRD